MAGRKTVLPNVLQTRLVGSDADIAYLLSQIKVTSDPAKRGALHLRMGKSLIKNGAFQRGRTHLEEARELTPDTPELLRSLGLALFRDGQISEGLRLYDKGRWQLPRFDKFRRDYTFPLWRGQPVRGRRLLVWAEQGIGDQIMQARVLQKLVRAGAEVTVECDPRLIPLFQRATPKVTCVSQTVPLVPALQMGNFDFQTSMLSAWRWIDAPVTGPASIKADPVLVKKYRAAWAKLDPLRPDLRNIGISWHSNAKATGAARSIPLSDLIPLAKTAGAKARFHNLQYGETDPQAISKAFGAALMTDTGTDPLVDLNRAAAQIKALDLVITIDNATAHLAGALGVQTWVFLPKASEYRWGRDPDVTALYPSVRLFRADDLTRWSGAILDLVDALEAW
ncbi:hypothetical protein [Algirhabdus cladophorae]|uniref:hypothetical protein n=1 Tax=Algirhabdus cladophorae TaxID=3377108 RepID=UPI003B8479B7